MPPHLAFQAKLGGHHSWECPDRGPCDESMLSLLPYDTHSPYTALGFDMSVSGLSSALSLSP